MQFIDLNLLSGSVWRVLLNAYNAVEYGEQVGNMDLVKKADAIYDSYLQHGFTEPRFFKEFVGYEKQSETQGYSIRHQSEGVFAVLN